MVSLKGLQEIVELDSRAMKYTSPLVHVGKDWMHGFTIEENTGFMRMPTIFIKMTGDGSRCSAGFRMYGAI
jgi:hypothetical protein